jgi:hypothetical protein
MKRCTKPDRMGELPRSRRRSREPPVGTRSGSGAGSGSGSGPGSFLSLWLTCGCRRARASLPRLPDARRVLQNRSGHFHRLRHHGLHRLLREADFHPDQQHHCGRRMIRSQQSQQQQQPPPPPQQQRRRHMAWTRACCTPVACIELPCEVRGEVRWQWYYRGLRGLCLRSASSALVAFLHERWCQPPRP